MVVTAGPSDDESTNVMGTVARAMDSHGQRSFRISHNLAMLIDLKAQLDEAKDPDECESLSEYREGSGRRWLAEWEMTLAELAKAAEREELLYEQDQGNVIRLGPLALANRWIARSKLWGDRGATDVMWGGIDMPRGSLLADYTMWSRMRNVQRMGSGSRSRSDRRESQPSISTPHPAASPSTLLSQQPPSPSSSSPPGERLDRPMPSYQRPRKRVALFERKRLSATKNALFKIIVKLAASRARRGFKIERVYAPTTGDESQPAPSAVQSSSSSPTSATALPPAGSYPFRLVLPPNVDFGDIVRGVCGGPDEEFEEITEAFVRRMEKKVILVVCQVRPVS